MDKVEVPLEVWVLRGSVEGGPVGPGKEPNGARRLIPVSEQPVCSHFHTLKVVQHREAQKHKAGGGQVHQPSDSQIGFLNIAGKKKKRQQRKGKCVFMCLDHLGTARKMKHILNQYVTVIVESAEAEARSTPGDIQEQEPSKGCSLRGPQAEAQGFSLHYSFFF